MGLGLEGVGAGQAPGREGSCALGLWGGTGTASRLGLPPTPTSLCPPPLHPRDTTNRRCELPGSALCSAPVHGAASGGLGSRSSAGLGLRSPSQGSTSRSADRRSKLRHRASQTPTCPIPYLSTPRGRSSLALVSGTAARTEDRAIRRKDLPQDNRDSTAAKNLLSEMPGERFSHSNQVWEGGCLRLFLDSSEVEPCAWLTESTSTSGIDRNSSPAGKRAGSRSPPRKAFSSRLGVPPWPPSGSCSQEFIISQPLDYSEAD
ncbi:PREDICTED: uncharacterized protein LOC105580658 [Cercocebus atys]|uniref:uncharacterized protein LOC105580658 n=1 Tax=Cercocebus atys TaxID=9531 RepID=UPI0005F3E5E1|nr:PREDICTED: uncharacterized protein LOC105580658 [Cercocebus atys]